LFDPSTMTTTAH